MVCGRLGSNSLKRDQEPVHEGLAETTWDQLTWSAANVQHCMHVGLGQPAVAATQTVERLEKALDTLQSIERFAWDQHDHVSFAKAWMTITPLDCGPKKPEPG